LKKAPKAKLRKVPTVHRIRKRVMVYKAACPLSGALRGRNRITHIIWWWMVDSSQAPVMVPL
jgi:hypothetical protein